MEFWMRSQRKRKLRKGSVKNINFIYILQRICYKGLMMQRNGIKQSTYEKNNDEQMYNIE